MIARNLFQRVSPKGVKTIPMFPNILKHRNINSFVTRQLSMLSSPIHYYRTRSPFSQSHKIGFHFSLGGSAKSTWPFNKNNSTTQAEIPPENGPNDTPSSGKVTQSKLLGVKTTKNEEESENPKTENKDEEEVLYVSDSDF